MKKLKIPDLVKVLNGDKNVLEISYPIEGEGKLYLWFGDKDGNYVGVIDKTKDIMSLKLMCEYVLEENRK